MGRTSSLRHWFDNLSRSFGLTVVSVLGFALLAAIAIPVLPVSAHAELVTSSPPADGLLVAPPRSIQLQMSERVVAGAGSPDIQVYDQQGREVQTGEARLGFDDATQISATVSGITTGTYTVVWSVRSEVDGHPLTGSFAFRVGEGRAPGAAIVEGGSPRAWAVITRWLTFIAAALAMTGIASLAYGSVFAAPRHPRVAKTFVFWGAVTAIIASTAEPILMARFPPDGATTSSFSAAFSDLPNGWWLRPAGGVALLAAMALTGRRPSLAITRPAVIFPILIIAGLSLTSHAAAKTDWRWVATGINLVHQFSVAVWFGGLLAIVIERLFSRRSESDPVTPLRAFARIALPAMALSVVTGAGNAGFVLPSLDSLWESGYGRLLLGKIAVVIVVLAFAARHRMRLRKAADESGPLFPRSSPAEALLGVAVIAIGATLAMLSPGKVESQLPGETMVALPIYDVPSGGNVNVRMTLTPARSGDNEIAVSFINQDRTDYTGELPERVFVNLSSIEVPVSSGPFQLNANADRTFSAERIPVGLDGWWRLELTLRWLGAEDRTLAYYLLLPDPNVFGLDAVTVPESDPAAEAVYTVGMAHMTGLHTVRYWQSMSDNKGNVATAEHIVNDGADGRAEPGFIYRAPDRYEAVVIGTTAWTSEYGGPWEVSETGNMIPPSEWDEEYLNAHGFRLGNQEVIDGELCQVITFVVPPTDRQVISYYAWWVGTETGEVRRDVMVSRAHYMTNDFTEFNTDLPLTIPEGAPMPAATPVD